RPMYGDTRVETNGGNMAGTTFTYLTSAKTFDLQAADALSRGCRVINPAADSIRLPHVEHLPLDTIEIEPLEKPAREILTVSLPPDDRETRIRLYKEELGEVDRVLEKLRRIKALSNKALDYNRKLFDQGQKGSGFHHNAKLDSIEKQFGGKYADTVKFIKHYGLQRLTPILRQHDQGVKDLEENNRLYFQAFVDTANELIELLHGARNRILSRLEEEKPQPNVQCLIEQWRLDQQPGRAIQWAQHHADYVSQLPEEQRQALHTFADTFEANMAELNELNLKRIANEGVKLDGLNGRAREYFLCRDEEGLLGLLAGLEEYRDAKQAKAFMPLVKGYLAELHGDTAAAIETYQEIVEGPAHIDALMRQFELHTKNQDLDTALQVLQVLSSTSSVYTPMFADLLQATGDVDSAVNIYTDYLLANPDDLNSMMKLGKIFHQYGSAEGVEWTMNYILGKDPGNQAARSMLMSLDSSQASG
ncbi:MAG: hypothetical protein LJE85_02330, partial [Gammaproteobacteria bacterium]|nr:hypothetical protein [Gammaproteobacteria bacterium]